MNMGMYTELNIGVELDIVGRQDVIDILNYMSLTGEKEGLDMSKYNHKLFATDRWKWMLNGSSYYFDAQPHCEFIYDKISNSYFLTCIFNIKNYSDEIECFLDFLSPYISSNGFIGYKRYEEQYAPTLLFKGYGGIKEINPNIQEDEDVIECL